VRERLRSRVFRVSTAVQVLLVVGLAVVSIAAGGGGPDTLRLGVAGADARLVGETARSQARAFDLRVELRPLADESAAR
jgi:hypothetical protein